LAISIIRGRLSLFQYPQGINLHKIFYTPTFKVDPYKASKKNIDAMNITSNDHELLFEIVAHLLDENKELKKRVDQLENKLPK
jgi:hypothetical protein